MERGRMNDPREEIMIQFSLTGRIIRIRMMWTRNLLRTMEGRLPKVGIGKTGTETGGLRNEGCSKGSGRQVEREGCR